MKPAICVAMLCIAGFGLLPQLSTMQPVLANNHTLEMTVVCDTFEVTGDFCLEFEYARSYKVAGLTNDPVFTDFKYLWIKANDISINDEFQDTDRTFKVETLGRTTLKIFPGEDIDRRILIKKIEGFEEKNSKMSFRQGLRKQSVFFGKDSVIYLENNFLDARPWIMELRGEFRLIDEETKKQLIDGECGIESSMEKAKIEFNGSLFVESPQVPSMDSLSLDFEFSDVEKLSLENCVANMKSDLRSDLKGNQFYDVAEDGLGIDMTEDFYKEDSYIKNFQLPNIKRMEIEEIKESDGRLMIKTPRTTYSEETLFPKIRVTTHYYLVNSEKEELLVKISNLNPTYYGEFQEEKVGFLVGKKYRVYIFVEKFVKDNITVDLRDNNCEYFIPKDGASKAKIIDLGLQKSSDYHEYFFTVDPRGIDRTNECWTEVSYCKTGQDTKPENGFTGIFKAEINCDISPRIDVKVNEKIDEKIDEKIEEKIEEKIDEKIDEKVDEKVDERSIDGGKIVEAEMAITLPSEISIPIIVDAFIIPDESFIRVFGDLHRGGELKGGESRLLRVELKTPANYGEKETCEIEFLVYYYIDDSAYYDCYKDVIRVTINPVEPTLTSHLAEILPQLLTLVTFFGSILACVVSIFLKEMVPGWGLLNIMRSLRPKKELVLKLSGLKEEMEGKEIKCPEYKTLKNLEEKYIKKEAENLDIPEEYLEKLKKTTNQIEEGRKKAFRYLGSLAVVVIQTLVLSYLIITVIVTSTL